MLHQTCKIYPQLVKISVFVKPSGKSYLCGIKGDHYKRNRGVHGKTTDWPSCGCFWDQHRGRSHLSGWLIYEFVVLASEKSRLCLKDTLVNQVSWEWQQQKLGCESVPWILMSAMLQLLSHTRTLKAPSVIITFRSITWLSAGGTRETDRKHDITCFHHTYSGKKFELIMCVVLTGLGGHHLVLCIGSGLSL